MIPADARLSIQILSLSQILVWEVQERYVNRVLHYIQLLKEHPGEYARVVSVSPSVDYPGLYERLDGHHRFAASLLTGRKDILALVIAARRSHKDAPSMPLETSHSTDGK
jgi:hypothetical protein